jgi:hypothetical protein
VKHTPGPWTVAPAGYDLKHAGNHWRVTAKSPHVDGLRQTVCELNGPWDEKNYAANGCLIAAAPELLEACEEAVESLEWTLKIFTDIPANSNFSKTLEKARAAIAKARAQ